MRVAACTLLTVMVLIIGAYRPGQSARPGNDVSCGERVTVAPERRGTPPEEEVTGAALRRAAALAAGDVAALRLLMHPRLQWTTFRGEVLGYEDYISGNTRETPRWRAQRLEGIAVVVAGDTAVLTAAVTDEVFLDGREQAFRLRLTQTWVRTPEGWRCLAGHASQPSR
jgi:ketosteroid isomerase-like protein